MRRLRKLDIVDGLMLVFLSYIAVLSTVNFFKIELGNPPTFVSVWWTQKELTPRLFTILTALEKSLFADAVQVYLYDNDLLKRAKLAGTGDLTPAQLDEEAISIEGNDVYESQLDDHVRNRCTIIKVSTLDKEGEYYRIVKAANRHTVVSCPLLESRRGFLIGYVAISFNKEPTYELDRLEASISANALKIGDFLSVEMGD